MIKSLGEILSNFNKLFLFDIFFNSLDLLRKLMSIHPIDPRGDQIHP